MAPDAEVLAAGARARVLVAGCALLLVGDVERADRLAQTALARAAAEPSGPDPLVRALATVARPRPADFEPPWRPGSRVELRDGGGAAPVAAVVADLRDLPAGPRAAVVLAEHGGLDAAQVAAALRTDETTARDWVAEARATLIARRPERGAPGRLAEELATAAAPAVASGSPAADLAHGRALVRRRRVRGAAALVAAALALVLGTATVLDRTGEVPQAASTPGAPVPAPSPTPSGPEPVTAACDIANPSCQATVMRRWRTTMSEVVVSHLDPEGTYFTGYSFSYDPRYESREFWSGGDGALGLEVFRLRGGATEVYVQVASGYDTAVRCGEVTATRCEGQRFMNGNRFTLSTTTQVARGIEVQHRPDGDQVVTVVARNTTKGEVLDVTRADLIDLVQDPRLRLPVI
ncbi:hypothetical protein ACFFOM_12715 [Microlunatus capsulatus]|uniref:RNA polymerase sigma factor 70 region 4 type 2 domain-containing protein n=1 Tax=Microlunatus capsulatus TaxID=99117 RepID=A0ABS4Z8T2_9ACTN|nr:hypothetical protein [Microlunatus capsulatus]MBP2417394.1 hypothetical protein [Microlunatus capsulatus]